MLYFNKIRIISKNKHTILLLQNNYPKTGVSINFKYVTQLLLPPNVQKWSTRFTKLCQVTPQY